MERGPSRIGGAVCALVVAVLLAGDAARAGEEAATGGAWVFDLRVVRVFARDMSVVEQGPAWAKDEASDPTVTLSWKEILATLKERGNTLLYLDRRVTCVEGFEAEILDTQTRRAEALEMRHHDNATFRGYTVETGVTARITPGPTLRYLVEVRSELGVSTSDRDVLLGQTRWAGTWPSLDGKTLVLVHRRQVPTGAETPPIPLEIYAFLTGRRVP